MISVFGVGFAAHGGCDLGVKIGDLVRVGPRFVADPDFERYLGRGTQNQRAVGHFECIVNPVSNQQAGLLKFPRDLKEVPAQSS
jgi:hypothetical protein